MLLKQSLSQILGNAFAQPPPGGLHVVCLQNNELNLIYDTLCMYSSDDKFAWQLIFFPVGNFHSTPLRSVDV